MENDPRYEWFRKAIQDDFYQTLILGKELKSITAETLKQQVQEPLTIDRLKSTMANLPKDPLLEKGIEKDWVCVINPALVSAIKQLLKDTPPAHYVSPLYELDYVMGRRVFIINEAPRNVEYMPELTMRMKYAEHFQRQLQALSQDDESDSDDE